MSSSPAPIAPRAQTVQRIARAHGFAMVGIAPAEMTPHADYIRNWLQQGRHGQMNYLLDQLQERLDPCQLVSGAKSIICVADAYPSQPHPPSAIYSTPDAAHEGDPDIAINQAVSSTTTQGRIARYAWSGDYHWVIKKRLHRLADELRGYYPGHTYRSCVDTAPTLEREHALRAGLGWVGKNTMLIHPKLGSYFLLGEIITTLPLATARDMGQTISDHCGTCTRCIDACPTRCLQPYQIDASRCISYLTIEHRDAIDPALHPAMGDWLAGCDVCQHVCPFNDRAEPPQTFQNDYTTHSPGAALPLLNVLNWDENARRLALTKSALKRIKLDQFKRNALIAAGNWLRDHRSVEWVELHERIKAIAADVTESSMVRHTAQQVLESV